MRPPLEYALVALLVGMGLACQSSAPPVAKPPVANSGSSSAPAATAAPPAMVPMKLGLVTPAVDVAPAWVAKEEGIFARYGLEVEMPTMGADLLMPALISGEVAMANMSQAAVVSAGLAGTDIAYYGTYENRLILWLYTRPEITAVPELRDKQVAITGRGGLTNRGLDLILQRNGLSPRDVTTVSTGSVANSTTVLLGNAVSGAMLLIPGIFQAEDAGMRMLVNAADYRMPTIIAGIAASRGWVARNEDQARHVLQAIAEGVAVAHQNKERTKQIIAQYTQVDDPRLLERTYEAAAPNWEKTLVVPPAAIQAELDSLMADNPAARDARPEQFIDNRLAVALEQSGFVERLYAQR